MIYAQLTDIIGAYQKIKVAKGAGLDIWEAVVMILFILKDILIVGGILGTIIWYIKGRDANKKK